MVVRAARTLSQRKQDTLARLEKDIDCWVATADAEGNACLVPLSYCWDGATIILATPENSPTGRNMAASGRARIALGPTRDVVIVHGVVRTYKASTVPAEVAEGFAARHSWDPRKETKPYGFYRVTPQRIQAWREENELKGRDLMVDGEWLA